MESIVVFKTLRHNGDTLGHKNLTKLPWTCCEASVYILKLGEGINSQFSVEFGLAPT